MSDHAKVWLLSYSKLLHQHVRNFAERPCLRTVWTGYHSGLAGVSVGADLRMEWNIAEEPDVHLFALASCSCRESVCVTQEDCSGLRTVKAKDVMVMTAIGANKGTHILHHAKYRNVDFLEEVDSSHGISEGKVLRCRDDHSACRSLAKDRSKASS